MRRLVPALLLSLAFPATAAAVGPDRPYDVRLAGLRAPVTRAVAPAVTHARLALRRSLGVEGVLRVDPLTGTPRVIARLDGFLSPPSGAAPERVLLGWAKRHRTVLGLAPRDFAGLELIQRATAPSGLTTLVWAQTAHGVRSLDTTLRGAVDRRGRIVWIGGSPLPGLNRARTTPKLSAAAALKAFPGRRLVPAQRILVNLGDRVALGWKAWIEVDSTHVYDVVVDARSGRLLRRVNRVESAAKVKAWDYYPKAEKGGEPTLHDMSAFLTATDRLEGNYTHTFIDTADDDTPDSGDEVAPSGGGDWAYDYMSVPSPAGNCPPAGCSWNHLVPDSWQFNLDQNAQQVFYFVNHYADHLKAAPIGFDEASGNFQKVNATGKGKGDDPVMANTTDGAATAVVVPNPLTNALNANMLTPPDGLSPRMQMYLFEPLPGLAPDFADVNGGDDASVIYHEFTHGLSNRLVIDGAGDGALLAAQSGAMGEAWSDFYAMDFLITQGLIADTDKPGELILGKFLDNAHNSLRTEAVDCTLGAPPADCPRAGADAGAPGQGGYTYEAFGKIIGSPEVHADSEIWSQTLTELRRELIAAHGAQEGERRALALVTGGLRLSPEEPSYLDMRNSILMADTVAGGRDHALIWRVFAHRGMGFDAQAVDGNDTHPVAGFALPPAPGGPTGSVSGKVTDVDTGAPLAGVPAGITAFFSDLDSDFAALTGTDGAFHITGVPAGNYGPVRVGGNGFEPVDLANAAVKPGQDSGGFDAKVRRNWAMLSGGARLTELKAKDVGCGPGLALDANPGTGISFYSDTNANDPGPKTFTVKLPAPVDVAHLVVDPSANCGDDLSASTAGYKVEFSTDGTTFQTASEGTFGADQNKPNDLTVPDAAKQNVRYVRMTMKNNQGTATEPTGMSTDWLDLTELSIYGTSRDKTAPKVKLPRRRVLRGPKATLRGRVSDDNGVLRVIAAGTAVTPDAKGAFRLPVTLHKGVNRITVDAYDASQNHGHATAKVRADLSKPRLKRVRAVRLSNGRARVTGLVRDDTGIRRLKVGGRKVKVRKGRFAVTLGRVKQVKLVATDKAGRRARKTVKVRR
jgi:hypothetical protein